jgi:hypothetical protein
LVASWFDLQPSFSSQSIDPMTIRPDQPGQKPEPITPRETAMYTADLVESLRKIALKQDQPLLAHLLELVAVEAKSLANGQDQDTRLPE